MNNDYESEWERYEEHIREQEAAREEEATEQWSREREDTALELSPKQQLVADFAKSDDRHCLAYGAIRSGKTFAMVRSFFEYTTHPDRAGYLHLICAQVIHLIRNEIFPIMRDLAQARGPNFTAGFNERTYMIYVGMRKNDRDIVDLEQPHTRYQLVAGTEKDTFYRVMGLTIHSAYFDEVCYVDKSFFQQMRGRLTFPDSKGFYCTNPATPRHWFKQDYIDRGYIDETHHFTFEDNPFLTEEYKADQRRNFVPGTAEHDRYILGVWAAAEGSIYRSYEVVDHEELLGDRLSSTPSDYLDRVIVGHDHGVGDPCVFQPIGEIGLDGVRLDYEDEGKAGWQRCRHIVFPALRIEDARSDEDVRNRLLEWIRENFGRNIHLYFVRDVAPVAANFNRELRRDKRIGRFKSWRIGSAYAVRGVGGMYGGSDRRALLYSIRKTNGLLASRRLIIDQRCKHLLDEIDGYEWMPDQREEQPKDGNDHHLDALRNAAMKIDVRVGGRLKRD